MSAEVQSPETMDTAAKDTLATVEAVDEKVQNSSTECQAEAEKTDTSGVSSTVIEMNGDSVVTAMDADAVKGPMASLKDPSLACPRTPVTNFMKKCMTPSSTGSNSPALSIPGSPFMKVLGHSCNSDLTVYLMERKSSTSSQPRSPWAIKKTNKRRHDLAPALAIDASENIDIEASVLQELKHPNIVGFRKLTKAKDGKPALAVEYLDKCENLHHKIEALETDDPEPFPADGILRVSYDISKALAYLHQEKCRIHGDLRSSSVLVQGNFEGAKLTDFKNSIALTDGKAKCPEEYAGHTAWAAPECLKAAPEVTAASEMFSFGLLLFELLTAEMPHFHVPSELELIEDEEEREKAWEEVEEKYHKSWGTRPKLPDCNYGADYQPAIELFYACTEEDPAKRPSASKVVEALEKHYTEVVKAGPVAKLFDGKDATVEEEKKDETEKEKNEEANADNNTEDNKSPSEEVDSKVIAVDKNADDAPQLKEDEVSSKKEGKPERSPCKDEPAAKKEKLDTEV